MATAPPPHATYDALVKAYRKRPGDHVAAAKAAKVVYRTARKAWLEGWPRLGWAPPIKDILSGDIAEQPPAPPPVPSKPKRIPQPPREEPIPVPEPPAPAPEPQAVAAAVTLITSASIKTKEQLAQLAQATRSVAIGHLSIVAEELRAIAPQRDASGRVISRGLLGRIQDDLRGLAENPVIEVEWDATGKCTKTRRYLPGELIHLHVQLVGITERTTRAAVLSMAMERTFLGTMIPLLDGVGATAEMSLEEALRVFEQVPAAQQQATALAGSRTVEPKGDAP